MDARVSVIEAPASVVVGQPFSARFRVLNLGATPMVPGQDKLGSVPRDTVQWGTNRIGLPRIILPGNSDEFEADNFAAAESGVFQFAWQALRESVAWYGTVAQSAQITVGDKVITAPSNVSEWPDPYPGGGYSSLMLLNTGPFWADGSWHSLGMTNDTDRTIVIRKVDTWLGVDLGGQVDTQLHVTRDSDGSFLILSPSDRYQLPGPPDGSWRQHGVGDFRLAPGDGLTVSWFANQVGQQRTHAHYQVLAYYG